MLQLQFITTNGITCLQHIHLNLGIKNSKALNDHSLKSDRKFVNTVQATLFLERIIISLSYMTDINTTQDLGEFSMFHWLHMDFQFAITLVWNC